MRGSQHPAGAFTRTCTSSFAIVSRSGVDAPACRDESDSGRASLVSQRRRLDAMRLRNVSAGDRWRPRVVRTSGSVTEAIYGLILATSVIAVSREYDSSNAGLLGVSVLVTGVVFWLAHVYARVLAGSISHHRMLNRSEVREALRHDWPLVEVTVPLVLILALGVLDVVPDRQRFSRRRLQPWSNWPLPVRTRRARQERRCAGRSCQPWWP
jgi:hypothetical protein